MMSLFSERADPTKNWLPMDGILNYYGQIIDREQADHYLKELLHHIDWRNDEAIIFGKKHFLLELYIIIFTNGVPYY